jgi:hypothetical protein
MKGRDIQVNTAERLFFACYADGMLRVPVSSQHYTVSRELTNTPPHFTSDKHKHFTYAFAKLRPRLPFSVSCCGYFCSRVEILCLLISIRGKWTLETHLFEARPGS